MRDIFIYFLPQKRLREIARFFCLIVCICLFMVITACATDRVGNDLATYMNQGILNIAELEKMSMMRYTSTNCKNCGLTDEDIYRTLKFEVVPNYQRFLYFLRDITPETDEVKKVHGIYVQGAEMIYGGFKIKMIGLKSKNPDLIRAAEDEIDKGMLETYQWSKDIRALVRKHKLGTERDKKYSSWF